MNKDIELLKNTIIIFLGRFCTQFISFFLVPLYTKCLLVNDYGYIDLVQTYISLFVPIIILRLDSAIFRYLIDARKDTKNKGILISTCLFFLTVQLLICLVMATIIAKYISIDYLSAIIINTISIALSNIILQIARGIGDNLGYSLASIICGVCTVFFNILFIAVWKWGAFSILISSSIGNILCIVFIIIKNQLYKYIKIKNIDKSTFKDMLKYSFPMIPDGLSWWIVNVSDRTIISYMLGASLNGIYAISCKFSNILSSIFTVFNITWQESASLHINEEDKNEFFSNILNVSLKLFFSACMIIMISMPYIFKLFVGDDYKIAYLYIPILLLGNLFNAVANVIGAVYIAKKNTKQIARTTLMAAIINIVVNIVFIKKMQLWAASFSTLISYIVLTLYRFYDVKKYIKFRIINKDFFSILTVYVIGCILYYINNNFLNIVNVLFVIVYLYYFNSEFIINIFRKLKDRVIKKSDK